MEQIRTFIAIPLPQEILNQLDKLNQEMQPISQGVKWVKPQSIHLTLKFLGNLMSDELERIFIGMDELFQTPEKEFSLTVGGMGAFPNFRRPRVLWIGVKNGEIESLKKMQNDIETIMGEYGFPKEERKFSPHLTVARIKFAKNLSQLIDAFSNYNFPEMELLVDRVQIMRSELRPTGAVYSVQKVHFLKQK